MVSRNDLFEMYTMNTSFLTSYIDCFELSGIQITLKVHAFRKQLLLPSIIQITSVSILLSKQLQQIGVRSEYVYKKTPE